MSYYENTSERYKGRLTVYNVHNCKESIAELGFSIPLPVVHEGIISVFLVSQTLICSTAYILGVTPNILGKLPPRAQSDATTCDYMSNIHIDKSNYAHVISISSE
jgi:hypothetical protein